MKWFYTVLLFLFINSIIAQELYFPPADSENWETLDPEELGWCPEKVDSLIEFVGTKNSKAFIVLVDGKIAIEAYYNGHDAESLWYWASAGKSLMAMLMGLAQEDGLLDIENPTSEYLGQGWTSCSPQEELTIKIRHQLSMASGLDDSLEAPGSTENCFNPECFECIAAPTTRWAYHNSAYRILQDVLETTSGQDKTIFTRTRLGNRIGMKGFWLNYIYYSNARDMARFGLLTLAQGNWAGDAVLSDMDYYNDMIRSSQDINPSYGYLWWLNGQPSYMLPALQISFDGSLIANAPSDMFAALGKNDQKIYVVPSQNMVVVRQGDAAGPIVSAASSFDNQLWERISDLQCLTATEEPKVSEFELFPNPARNKIRIISSQPYEQVLLYDRYGQLLRQWPNQEVIQVDDLAPGLYLVQLRGKDFILTKRLIIQP